MQITEILSHFDHVRKNGVGYLARCRAHDDSNPSVSIDQQNGKVLLHCHAGCSIDAVLSAHGLTKADLFASNGHAEHGRIIAEYVYRDPDGLPIGRVLRTDPKRFFQQRYVKGRWENGGFPPILYNLPAVLLADNSLILEGEKDCETARSLGYVATCNPGGAGKWPDDYSQYLRGKNVTVVSDADAAGLSHAHQVVKSLMNVAGAGSVKLIEALPGTGVKDLSDFRGKFPDNASCREMLEALIHDAPCLTREDVEKWREPKADSGFHFTRVGALMDEPEEQVAYLLDGTLVTSGSSLLAAKPKDGKTTLGQELALRVARGETFLGRKTQQGAVVCLFLEEKRSEVRKHFRRMGADGSEEIYIHCAHAPADALQAITEEIKSRKPVLLIIDPLLRFTRLRDGNDYAEVTRTLEPLLVLAREHGVHVLLIHHLGKGERVEATDGILGSTALFASVDTALILKRREKYRTLQSRQRYGEDLPETVLVFDSEHGTLSLGGTRFEADIRACEDIVLSFLKDAGAPRTQAQIRDAVEGKTSLVRSALTSLVASHKVLKSGEGKRSQPFVYQVAEL